MFSALDVPTSRPSSRASRSAIARASSSSIARASSYGLPVMCGGIRPVAMPSTRCAPPRPGSSPASWRARARRSVCVAAAFTQRPRDAAQHAAGADGAAEHVERSAGLLQQLSPDAGVSVDRIHVVKLIGPERVRLGREDGDLASGIARRAPASPCRPRSERFSAPRQTRASSCSFSSAKASDDRSSRR